MGGIFLAINYGVEGWQLTPFFNAGTALDAVKNGDTFGSEWKILKEIDVGIKEESE